MTRQEYADYEATVKAELDGLNNLSTKDSEQEPYFSHQPCSVCNRGLGGNRYDCSGFNGNTKEVEEVDGVCEDCVYYAEYGCLDDDTMMGIEEEGEGEPEEGDYVSEDHQRWYQYGKLVLVVPEDEDYVAALTEHMQREEFFPNVWIISDHGNSCLVDMGEDVATRKVDDGSWDVDPNNSVDPHLGSDGLVHHN